MAVNVHEFMGILFTEAQSLKHKYQEVGRRLVSDLEQASKRDRHPGAWAGAGERDERPVDPRPEAAPVQGPPLGSQTLTHFRLLL